MAARELDVGSRSKGLEGCTFKIEVWAAENEEQWGKHERSVGGGERFRARGGFELVSWVLSGFLVEGPARDRRVKRLEGRLIETKRLPVVEA